jgi:tryptophan synthase alpha chain
MKLTLKNNRLNKKFDELSKKNEHALICYVVAGYPDVTTTEDIISSLVLSGADIIEIGIPFSDPIADGSVIQEASHQALLSGITPEKCLNISQNIRSKFPDLPILIMTYSNILLKAGFKNFMRRSKLSGVDGFILPDMAIEESCC